MSQKSTYKMQMEYHYKTSAIEDAEDLFRKYEDLYDKTVKVGNDEYVKLLFCLMHELKKQIIDLRQERHALLVVVYPPQIKDGGDNV